MGDPASYFKAQEKTASQLVMKFVVRNPALYKEPEGQSPPPWWIRGLLILICTGVSFAHGSNDGQKGMGLIMLILIGTVPTAYALNRSLPATHIASFSQASTAAITVVEARTSGHRVMGDPRPAVTDYISRREFNEGTLPSLVALMREIDREITTFGDLAKIHSPPSAIRETTSTSRRRRRVSS